MSNLSELSNTRNIKSANVGRVCFYYIAPWFYASFAFQNLTWTEDDRQRWISLWWGKPTTFLNPLLYHHTAATYSYVAQINVALMLLWCEWRQKATTTAISRIWLCVKYMLVGIFTWGWYTERHPIYLSASYGQPTLLSRTIWSFWSDQLVLEFFRSGGFDELTRLTFTQRPFEWWKHGYRNSG